MLAVIGGPPSSLGPTLAGALRDMVELVREAAAEGMDERGADRLPDWTAPNAGNSLEARGRTAADPNARVRVAAVTALGLLGDRANRPAPRQALADADATVRREAEHALSALHRRHGGEDTERHPLPEPSPVEVCKSNPRVLRC